ncbi:unnamed protein product [Euphydryas editha]|uniref:Uncharacterized protein n=1 Tax=Euphydryas editha TaxID=104508 RepID=A0AAU9VCF2_EUPED|nr:unnamed protein product [Euphydryas editha]
MSLFQVVVVRERDLLRLVVPDGRSRLASLKEEISKIIEPRNLKLQIHDAPQAAFYDNDGPCFQFRKTDTGEALSPKATRAALRAAGEALQAALLRHGVRGVAPCGAPRTAQHSPAQRALLLLAAALPLAALLAAVCLCCLRSRAKSRMRAAMRAAHESAAAAARAPRLLAEPLYST